VEVLGAAERDSRAGKCLGGTRRDHSLPRVAVAPDSTGVRRSLRTALCGVSPAVGTCAVGAHRHTFHRSGCVPFADGGLRTEH
jgi:hypothetical protein